MRKARKMGLSLFSLGIMPTRRTILQCEACGAHVVPNADGWFKPCDCGSTKLLSMMFAPWKLSADDRTLLKGHHDDLGKK